MLCNAFFSVAFSVGLEDLSSRSTLAFLAAGGESDPEPGVQSSTGAGGTAEEEAGVATELDIYWKEHMSYSFWLSTQTDHQPTHKNVQMI